MSNENVALKPLSIENAARLADLANNANIWQQLKDIFPHPYTLDDALFFITGVQSGTFGIVESIWYRDEFVGIVSLIPQSDVYQRNAEIGYWLGEPFWGKGIATEAISQMVRKSFEQQPGLVRLFAGVFSSNPGSMHVLEKNGFILEGISPKAIFKNGTLLDEHRYGLVRTT
ncbi:GNAT family N-acetyltransferase [Spirosoma soli]|uniref:GNAT family N-acetyltransferase n=1 Tax=Spirosoma soli TaxID=1770529 RepID=A0ABW5M1U0_9BACT